MRFTRLVNLQGEDVVWACIEELPKVKTCGWSVYGVNDEALNFHSFTMMDGWMDGWIDGWMDGWMDDGSGQCLHKNFECSTAMSLMSHTKFHIYMELF